MKDQRSILFSLDLWHSLQVPPPRHWERRRSPLHRADQTALVLSFVLSALALLSGVILSALVTYRTADRVARARENGTFDLLAVTPGGGFGASWGIFAGMLHYDLTLRTLRRMCWNALRAVLILGVVTLLPVVIPTLEHGESLYFTAGWPWLMFLGFLLPMMAFDYLYAVVSGGLIGVLMPTYFTSESRVAAIFAGVVLHLTAYVTAAVVGALMLPVIFHSLGIGGWLADVFRVLMALVAFVLVHEATALLLYRVAQTRLTGLEEHPLAVPPAA
jgi:hypothetical protein